MSCRDFEKIFSEAFDDRLDTETRMRFETHLAGCNSCSLAYRRYEELFEAVAAMPGIVNEAPVPYPETARSFHPPQPRLSTGARIARYAAMILVLIGAGYLGSEIGSPGDPDPNETAKLDPSEVVMPEAVAAQQLRLLSDDARKLATVTELAPNYADDAMVQLVGHANGKLRRRSRDLLDLEPQRFGSFDKPMRDLAGELDAICRELEMVLVRKDAADRRLSQARLLVRQRNLGARIEAVERVARVARAPAAAQPTTDDPNELVWTVLDHVGRRDAPRALHFIQVAEEQPHLQGTSLHELMRHLRVFVRTEVGRKEPQEAFQVIERKGFHEAIRPLHRGGQAVWIGSPNEIRIEGQAQQGKVLRVLVNPARSPKKSLKAPEPKIAETKPAQRPRRRL